MIITGGHLHFNMLRVLRLSTFISFVGTCRPRNNRDTLLDYLHVIPLTYLFGYIVNSTKIKNKQEKLQLLHSFLSLAEKYHSLLVK